MTTLTATTEVTCPFCGLLCDDLVASRSGERIEVDVRDCPIARDGFARSLDPGGLLTQPVTPLLDGAEATFEQALNAAAALLRTARQPLIGGMATDIAGARAAVALADQCGAVVDHVNSRAKFRNLLAQQDRGTISTTLAEVRNRADLVVVIGDVTTRYPRLFERVFAGPSLFGLEVGARKVIRIGRRETSPGPAAAIQIAAETHQLPDLLAALAALVAGRRIERAAIAGLDVEALGRVASAMREARYGVVTWAAAELDFPHAELAVQAVGTLLADLNRTTRFAAFALGGTDGDLSADAVLLWQTGFPFRTSFASGAPQYDPVLNDGARMLERGEADVLLWISSLGPQRLPATSVPTIVLAPAAHLRADPTAASKAVVIPIGVPGIDHVGHLVRVDKVVTLRLAPVLQTASRSAADVLEAIRARL